MRLLEALTFREKELQVKWEDVETEFDEEAKDFKSLKVEQPQVSFPRCLFKRKMTLETSWWDRVSFYVCLERCSHTLSK